MTILEPGVLTKIYKEQQDPLPKDPTQALSSLFGVQEEKSARLEHAILEIIEEPNVAEETQEVKDQTQEVLLQLKKGKALHDAFAHEFQKEYKVSGKLMSEWRQEFKLDIPPDLNPKVCQDLAVKLMELHQEASFMKAVADARMRACQSASNIKYRQEFNRLVSEARAKKEKLPARGTLEQLADNQVGDVKDAVAHAEIELSFWKEILSDLSNCRKLLENATINISVEAKTIGLQQQSGQYE